MGESVRWLHLSDFHVGKDEYAQRRIFDHILTDVAERRADGFDVDLVVVTGDIANGGQSEEHAEFWLSFALPLCEVLGVSDPEQRIFVVPGNHDVDRDEHQAFDRAELASAKSRAFDPTDEGARLRRIVLPRFSSFIANSLTSTSAAFAAPDGAFTTEIDVRGTKVGIAGINTAWLSKDDADREHLTPGKELLERALETIAGADVRLVLGHHPIDWLLPAHQKPIKALLAKHSALYLHGHLHENWTEPSYGSGAMFLTVQAGAAFQAREGERWRNGFLLAALELDRRRLLLQPRQWTPQHQSWSLVGDAYHESLRDGSFRDGGWWSFPLPGSEVARKALDRFANADPPVPEGWALLDAAGLKGHLSPLTEDQAIVFFDGAVPNWETALSTSLPRRNIVRDLASRYATADDADRPIVTALLAPACEGKSTALLQAAYEIVRDRPDWRILQLVTDSASADIDRIVPLLRGRRPTLLVVDEADPVARSLLATLSALPGHARQHTHALLACRDSDWIAAGAAELGWPAVCSFHELRLIGLGADEAEAIVGAWSAFGQRGLGHLAGVAEAQRAGKLQHEAHDALVQSPEAFFGALLAVRHGNDIESHARTLLHRLAARNIQSGGTLEEALLLVAAMHAEGLDFLSRSVLAQALGCPLNRLQRDVIMRLGREAAATSTSTFVLTRHQRIAEAVVAVAERELGVDMAQLFATLVSAAVTLRHGDYVPRLVAWRHDLPDHFMATGRPYLAIQVGRIALDDDPDNVRLIVKLASIYRKADDPEAAAELCQAMATQVHLDRAFYCEWATAVGSLGRSADNIALTTTALSDQCSRHPVDNDEAKIALAGAGVQFSRLFEEYEDPRFRDASIAAAVLGRALRLDTRAARYFKRYFDDARRAGAEVPDLRAAPSLLWEGRRLAEELLGSSLSHLLVDHEHLTFASLSRLVGVPTATPAIGREA